MNDFNLTLGNILQSSAVVDQTYKIGELFAGAGGMALGAHLAQFNGHGYKHVLVNDIDRDASDTFANNFLLIKIMFIVVMLIN